MNIIKKIQTSPLGWWCLVPVIFFVCLLLLVSTGAHFIEAKEATQFFAKPAKELTTGEVVSLAVLFGIFFGK